MRAERRFAECYTGGKYSDQWILKGQICVIKTSQLMLYREIIVVCSQIHTKHINTMCGQNLGLLNVTLVVNIVTTRLLRVNRNRDVNLWPFHRGGTVSI